MNTSLEHAHATVSGSDAPAQMMAIVLTNARVVRQGIMEYHVPAGSVIGLKRLPKKHTFNPGKDAKLIVAGDHRPGDIVSV